MFMQRALGIPTHWRDRYYSGELQLEFEGQEMVREWTLHTAMEVGFCLIDGGSGDIVSHIYWHKMRENSTLC